MGLFENRCRITELPVNGTWPILEGYNRLCGATSCPEGFILTFQIHLSLDHIVEILVITIFHKILQKIMSLN